MYRIGGCIEIWQRLAMHTAVLKTCSRTDRQTNMLIAILRSPTKNGIKSHREQKCAEHYSK